MGSSKKLGHFHLSSSLFAAASIGASTGHFSPGQKSLYVIKDGQPRFSQLLTDPESYSTCRVTWQNILPVKYLEGQGQIRHPNCCVNSFALVSDVLRKEEEANAKDYVAEGSYIL